jgi:prepilin-type processing-associated H-X9-DG protein
MSNTPVRTDRARAHDGRAAAFTLVEVLVVSGVVAVLLSILLPSLTSARRSARTVVCGSNIRQLAAASHYYAQENDQTYCPGAAGFLRNLHRWHGTRDRPGDAFDPSRGPLVGYLGQDGAIRRCPSFPIDEIAALSGGFERGNGGYGYNNAYIGVRLAPYPAGTYVVRDDRTGAKVDRVRRPGETVLFTDSAFVSGGLIEYSFAEPRYHPQYTDVRALPSIHFRHRERANVAWCDGHVDAQERTFTHNSPFYSGDPERYDIGWFGQSDDNRLFDLN